MASSGGGAEPKVPLRKRAPSWCPGGVARQLYHCDVCNAAIVSYDLKSHYKSKTDFVQLQRLVDGEEVVGEIGPHTRYMWEKGFTEENLPSYRYHKMQKTVAKGPMDSFLGRRAVEEQVGGRLEGMVESVRKEEEVKGRPEKEVMEVDEGKKSDESEEEGGDKKEEDDVEQEKEDDEEDDEGDEDED